MSDLSLIRGSAERIGPLARSWHDRRRPALMILATATFLELAGEDLQAAARETAADLDCPLLVVPAKGFDGDLFDGYARVILEASRLVDWRAPAAARGEVSVTGYLFDRYEADHAGNLQQLKFLLEGVGLRLGPVWFSGRPWDVLQKAGRSEVLVQLPYARPVEDELAAACAPRQPLRTDLPIGLAGTSRWLRTVAAATGRSAARTEEFIDAQLGHAMPQLAKVARSWRGVRLALFADTPLAAGLCSLLSEMGIECALVGLRDVSLGGRQAFEAALRRDGVALPGECVVLERPGLREASRLLFESLREHRIQALIGSAVELNLLAGFDAEQWTELAWMWTPARSRREGLISLEIGFPSSGYHATRPEPILGFGGAVSLAQRMLNARPM